MIRITRFIVGMMLLGVGSGCGCASVGSTVKGVAHNVRGDYHQFYSLKRMGYLAAGGSVAGVLANSNADQELRDWYQETVRDERTDDVAQFVKPFGNGRIIIPVLAGMTVFGKLARATEVGAVTGNWASRSLRTMLVGAPPLLLLQNALGAHRPKEEDSHWHPFEDDHGVSGHSFMGAAPFLSAALLTDNPYLKTAFYLGSTACGLSRINDDKHYVSQAAFGWWLAYLSAKSVADAERQPQKVIMAPTISQEYIGVVVNIPF